MFKMEARISNLRRGVKNHGRIHRKCDSTSLDAPEEELLWRVPIMEKLSTALTAAGIGLASSGQVMEASFLLAWAWAVQADVPIAGA